jgi:lipopolysaccharide export system permease protein
VILDRYLVKQFLPIFFIAAAMFVMLLSLIDLFANLWRYLNYEVPLAQIFRISLFYLPKSFSFAFPISLLFAAAYTLGELYARNELTSVFASGIPFGRFSLPLIAIGIIASVFSFFFDDLAVIPTMRTKNDLSRMLLRQQRLESNSDIVIKAKSGGLIYSVDYYDEAAEILNGLSIVELDEKGEFVSLVRSSSAVWTGTYWLLSNPLVYEWDRGMLRTRVLPETDVYREDPGTFRRSAVNVTELPVRDARLLVRDLRTAGLPFIEALTDYYHRFSFSSAPFVVMILSISMGGRFRKNILLMSLLSSLGAAVFYYVMEMISMMMARLGYLPPLAGAWFPVAVFTAAGVLLLRGAKT